MNIEKIVNPIQFIESQYMKSNKNLVSIGDIINISYLIPEGNKERIQRLEGVVISKKHGGINETITLRRSVDNVGLEQILLINSPKIAKIEVKQHSVVRRAKLYYLRKAKGKKAKLIQKF